MESKQKIKERKRKEAEVREAQEQAEAAERAAIEDRRKRLIDDIKDKRAKMVTKLASLARLGALKGDEDGDGAITEDGALPAAGPGTGTDAGAASTSPGSAGRKLPSLVVAVAAASAAAASSAADAKSARLGTSISSAVLGGDRDASGSVSARVPPVRRTPQRPAAPPPAPVPVLPPLSDDDKRKVRETDIAKLKGSLPSLVPGKLAEGVVLSLVPGPPPSVGALAMAGKPSGRTNAQRRRASSLELTAKELAQLQRMASKLGIDGGNDSALNAGAGSPASPRHRPAAGEGDGPPSVAQLTAAAEAPLVTDSAGQPSPSVVAQPSLSPKSFRAPSLTASLAQPAAALPVVAASADIAGALPPSSRPRRGSFTRQTSKSNLQDGAPITSLTRKIDKLRLTGVLKV